MPSRITQLYHRLDGNTKEVIKGAASALVLRMSGAALSFALSVVLGRMLGASGVGLYFLALSVVTIATVLGRVGLDNTLLRFAAASADMGDWAAVKGLYVKSVRLTLAASGLMAILLILFTPWLSDALFSNPNLTGPLRVMALAVVPTALFIIVAQLLQGLRRTKDGIAVLSVWAPAFCLAGAFILVPYLGIQGAAVSYTLAATLTALIAWWRWHQATPQTARLTGYFSTEKLLQSSMPLFWVSMSQLIIATSSTVILGMWSTSADVGIYGTANRVVTLLSFFMLSITSIASPKFSALYQEGDMRALGALAKSSTKLLVLAASPAFVILFLAPAKVMSVFGSEFASGATVILVLAVGQLINIVTGPAGNVLMMCGHERLVRNTLVASAFVCVIFSLLLIPEMGIVGAAWASSITTSFQNLIMVALVWRKFEIMIFPVSFDWLRRTS